MKSYIQIREDQRDQENKEREQKQKELEAISRQKEQELEADAERKEADKIAQERDNQEKQQFQNYVQRAIAKNNQERDKKVVDYVDKTVQSIASKDK
jgi:Skp family chaperone for outer membrane proteins